MSEKRDEGGAAFPADWRSAAVDNCAGITLRDYFAAKAMQGILACFRDYTGAEKTAGRVALAYCIADAMLLERAKCQA